MNYSQRSNSVNFTIIGFITNHLVYHSLKKLNSKKLFSRLICVQLIAYFSKTTRCDQLHKPHIVRGFCGGSDSEECACDVGDLGLIPGLGGCPGEGNDNPLQYSCLENSMNREGPGGLQSMRLQRVRCD